MSEQHLTAAGFLSRSLEDEQRRFVEEAESLADHAARIAARPPASGRSTVSGDLTRLIQEATFLLKRAVTIEASLEAVGLMAAEAGTPDTEK